AGRSYRGLRYQLAASSASTHERQSFSMMFEKRFHQRPRRVASTISAARFTSGPLTTKTSTPYFFLSSRCRSIWERLASSPSRFTSTNFVRPLPRARRSGNPLIVGLSLTNPTPRDFSSSRSALSNDRSRRFSSGSRRSMLASRSLTCDTSDLPTPRSEEHTSELQSRENLV